MRSVSLFMQVEVDQVFLTPQADRHCQALIRRILLPLLQDLQVREGLCPIHLHKGHSIRDRAFEILQVIERRQGPSDSLLVIAFWEMIQAEINFSEDSLFHDQLTSVAVLDIDNRLDILRQRAHHILHEDQ